MTIRTYLARKLDAALGPADPNSRHAHPPDTAPVGYRAAPQQMTTAEINELHARDIARANSTGYRGEEAEAYADGAGIARLDAARLARAKGYHELADLIERGEREP